MKSKHPKVTNACGRGCTTCAACPSAEAKVEVEWARISDRQAVVATADQMWIRELDRESGLDPFAEPMSGPGSEATTRQLLDAAWCAGRMAVAKTQPDGRRSLLDYVWEVIGLHYSTSATPKLLTEVAERFRKAGRDDLEIFARRFAKLEAGDEQMALDDLKALGYDADDLVRSCTPPANILACVDYFADRVRGPEPLEVFGYAYAVERSSLAITQDDLRVYEELLPPGINALTCRWHHSGVGGDVAHVKFFIRSASRLPGEDRARLARAVYDATAFILNLPIVPDASDAGLETLFANHRIWPEAGVRLAEPGRQICRVNESGKPGFSSSPALLEGRVPRVPIHSDFAERLN
jgi:hypothetical protein